MKLKGTLALVLALLLIGVGVVKAQAVTFATPYAFAVTGTLANCPALSTIPTGTGMYCNTNLGPYFAAGGAIAWTSLLPGAAAAPALTLNGTTKTLPASFTIAAAAPAVNTTATATAPTVSVN